MDDSKRKLAEAALAKIEQALKPTPADAKATIEAHRLSNMRRLEDLPPEPVRPPKSP